jgi:hypothetical protein
VLSVEVGLARSVRIENLYQPNRSLFFRGL